MHTAFVNKTGGITFPVISLIFALNEKGAAKDITADCRAYGNMA